MELEHPIFSTGKLNVLAMLLVLLSRFLFIYIYIKFSFSSFISSFLVVLFASCLIFQLLQIQKQYKLIKPGSSVLDLGCAPGAWLQVFLFIQQVIFFDGFFLFSQFLLIFMFISWCYRLLVKAWVR